MIRFNGKDLTDIAPVKIDDIDVSPIQLNAVARQRAETWGADFVRMTGGTRTVTVSFAVLEINQEDREQMLQDVRDWCTTNKEATLELPEFANRHLECICTQMPDHSYRKWWENKLKLVFTCFSNPYWTSNELIETPCGSVFSIGGSAPPLVTITRSSPTTSLNQTYATTSASMSFSRVPSGNLTIDLNRQTAAIGKTSIMQYYNPASTWIKPQIGANQRITGTGTVSYRERWV